MNVYAGFFLDVVILGVMAAVIVHARRLSRQFEQTQADRRAFEQLIQALNLAASRAEAAVRTLREAATVSGEELQETVNKARAMSGELEIMIQAGDTLADRLSKVAETSRKAVAPAHPVLDDAVALPDSAAEPAVKQPATAQPRTRAEKELLEALKAKKNP